MFALPKRKQLLTLICNMAHCFVFDKYRRLIRQDFHRLWTNQANLLIAVWNCGCGPIQRLHLIIFFTDRFFTIFFICKFHLREFKFSARSKRWRGSEGWLASLSLVLGATSWAVVGRGWPSFSSGPRRCSYCLRFVHQPLLRICSWTAIDIAISALLGLSDFLIAKLLPECVIEVFNGVCPAPCEYSTFTYGTTAPVNCVSRPFPAMRPDFCRASMLRKDVSLILFSEYVSSVGRCLSF